MPEFRKSVDDVNVVADPPTLLKNPPPTAKTVPGASANAAAAVSVVVAVEVAFWVIVQPPVALLKVRFANDELPGLTSLPVTEELNNTVPPFAVKAPPVDINDAPDVNVPVGSVVVPLWKVTVLLAVTLVSVKVSVFDPANNKLYAAEPLNLIVCAADAVNLSVPELCVKLPPFAKKDPPTL